MDLRGLYLTWLPEDASQRPSDLREVEDALRWIVRTAAFWRMIPHDLPRWDIVHQQTQQWLVTCCFEAMVHDIHLSLRAVKSRKRQNSSAVFDSCTVQLTPESAALVGCAFARRRKGSKVHEAMDTLGHLLSLLLPPFNKQDCAQGGELAQTAQQVTGSSVEVTFVDQGYTDMLLSKEQSSRASNWKSSNFQAMRDFLLLTLRWVVERFFARIVLALGDRLTIMSGLRQQLLVYIWLPYAVLTLYQWISTLSPQ